VNPANPATFTKVPEITLLFWMIKILCTTLGETAGDAVSMSMNLGYLLGTGIFAVIFVIVVSFQITAKHFHPVLYWLTIITTTTVGTTLADFADRSLGVGYAGGTAILSALLLLSLLTWHLTLGSISVNTVNSSKAEIFYWATIIFSQTLGTALGDWMADTAGFGYVGSALVFSAVLAAITVIFLTTHFSRTILFWAAFILTRPLGAVIGDFLDKPVVNGGLELSRYTASATLFIIIALGIVIFPQRAAQKTH
jgi:uncharacterized membrane-anchored protein